MIWTNINSQASIIHLPANPYKGLQPKDFLLTQLLQGNFFHQKTGLRKGIQKNMTGNS